MPDESSATPRDFFAAERTFLAWIRTGLALMGLGFVLARFGLFLQEFSFNQPNLRVQSYGLSLWFGTALIFLASSSACSRWSATGECCSDFKTLRLRCRGPRRLP